MRRRSLPVDFEGFVQRSQMRLEVRLNAAIRIGPAHDGENGKQQYVRQPIEFALGATRVRDCGEQRQKRLQGARGASSPCPATPVRRSAYSPRVRSRPLVLSRSRSAACCCSSGTSRENWRRYFCRRADFCSCAFAAIAIASRLTAIHILFCINLVRYLTITSRFFRRAQKFEVSIP